jgi:hypothetical protein
VVILGIRIPFEVDDTSIMAELCGKAVPTPTPCPIISEVKIANTRVRMFFMVEYFFDLMMGQN